jgi:bis(5'-nucleosidyl)-tetraphosphatase
MAKEHSAGAVVFTEANEGRKYLILHYEAGHWSFPKGKLEKDEQPLDTARREIREETGLEVEFVPGYSHEVNYFFKRGSDTVDKTVEFFLARAKDTGVRLSFEHIGFRWLAYADALKQLTFENDSKVLSKAEQFLDRR